MKFLVLRHNFLAALLLNKFAFKNFIHLLRAGFLQYPNSTVDSHLNTPANLCHPAPQLISTFHGNSSAMPFACTHARFGLWLPPSSQCAPRNSCIPRSTCTVRFNCETIQLAPRRTERKRQWDCENPDLLAHVSDTSSCVLETKEQCPFVAVHGPWLVDLSIAFGGRFGFKSDLISLCALLVGQKCCDFNNTVFCFRWGTVSLQRCYC